MMNNPLYNVVEYPPTQEGKFGGYKVLPTYNIILSEGEKRLQKHLTIEEIINGNGEGGKK